MNGCPKVETNLASPFYNFATGSQATLAIVGIVPLKGFTGGNSLRKGNHRGGTVSSALTGNKKQYNPVMTVFHSYS
jgi:hypothetical protein